MFFIIKGLIISAITYFIFALIFLVKAAFWFLKTIVFIVDRVFCLFSRIKR